MSRLGKGYERKLGHFRFGPVLFAALLLSFVETENSALQFANFKHKSEKRILDTGLHNGALLENIIIAYFH